jgi:hypothetical protein
MLSFLIFRIIFRMCLNFLKLRTVRKFQVIFYFCSFSTLGSRMIFTSSSVFWEDFSYLPEERLEIQSIADDITSSATCF